MEKRGVIIITGIISLFLVLIIFPFTLSAQTDLSTICYNEKHSIINHEITCEFQNNLQSSLSHEVAVNLNLLNKKVRNTEIYEYVEKTKEVPVYETVCNPYDEESKNGTLHYENCTQIQTGTKTVSYEELEKLNINSDSEKVKWSAGQLQFKAIEKRKFLIIWKTNLDKIGSGWGSSGNWKINPENWWNINWTKRKSVNITGGEENLYNFTVLLNISYSNNMSFTDFRDIRFINESCSSMAQDTADELYFEFDKIVNSNSALVWIKIPVLNTGINQICMYYSNPDASSSQNTIQTWFDGSSSNEFVMHFTDNSSAFNSYSPSDNWTIVGTLFNSLDCVFGQCFNSTYALYNYTSHSRIIDNTISVGTFSYWVKNNNNLLAIGSGGRGTTGVTTQHLIVYNYTYGYLNVNDQIAENFTASFETPFKDKWFYIVMKWNSSNTYLYINSQKTITLNTNGPGTGGGQTDFLFRTYHTSGNTQNVSIDEVKFERKFWNDNYINRDYQNANFSMVVFGEEEPYDEIAPTWKDNWTSATAQTKKGDVVYFNITLEDNKAGGIQIFSFYNGTTWKNDTEESWTTPTTLSESRTITAIKNQQVRWRWYFSDAAGNKNETPIWNFTVANSPPNQSNPLLSTPSGKNFSYENLTCYNQSTYDADNDIVTNIYNWYKNSQPLTVLNMPLENNTKDYSGYNNDGTKYGATFTEGKVGRASSFDGVDDYVYIADSNSLDFTNKKTWQLWFKRVNFNTLQMLFDKTNINSKTNYRLALRPDNKLEFSYHILLIPTSLVWIKDTQNEFNLGVYNQTKWNGTAVTLNLTLAEQQIFFDGFESGTFFTNNWATTANTNNWTVSNETPYAYEGIYHASVIDTGGVVDRSTIEVNISTVGFTNINVSYKVQRLGLDAADDFTAEYFNGTGFRILETGGGVNDLFYWNRSFLLSSDADNNPNFKLRFSCAGAGPDEGCRLDNVEVRGNGTAFYNNGNYTSEIFDAGDISEWKNFSWTETLPTNTDLTFQIRSCDDFECTGENFVGPNNATNIYFTNSEFNDISFITDNKYFQYKAYFSTTDIKKSPGLFSVSVSYIRNTTNGLINLTSTTAITDTSWHYAAITFDDAILTDNLNLYLDSILEATKTEHGIPEALDNDLYIGKRYPENNSFFNGSIDEVRIYPYALTSEQISAYYNLEYNKIVSEETAGGDVFMCQVTPNDAEEDGLTLNSSIAEIKWAITFDVRDSYSNASLNGASISCNYSGFNQAPYTTNPYGPYGFPSGNWECNFVKSGYYGKTQIFTVDDDKTIYIKLSEEKQLTPEEHTWLEAIYNCLYLGDCKALDLLEQINQTTTLVWDQIKRTDQDVVIKEDVTSYVVNATSNLSIDYTVNIPEKAGYSVGNFLPIRLAYWFLDENNETCYDQGDKPTGVEKPYCYPLITETLGPMKGQVNFTVDLRPSLPVGTYTIIRDIEIDPQGNWIKYGQEIIGEVKILNSVSKAFISLTKDKESGSSNSSSNEQRTNREGEDTETGDNNVIEIDNKNKITGSVIGEKIFNKDNLLFIWLGLITFLIVYQILFSKIKKNQT